MTRGHEGATLRPWRMARRRGGSSLRRSVGVFPGDVEGGVCHERRREANGLEPAMSQSFVRRARQGPGLLLDAAWQAPVRARARASSKVSPAPPSDGARPAGAGDVAGPAMTEAGEQRPGRPLTETLAAAGGARLRPIFFTVNVAMLAVGFLLLEPLLRGRAISLLPGRANSTALTPPVVPAISWLQKGGGRREATARAPRVTARTRHRSRTTAAVFARPPAPLDRSSNPLDGTCDGNGGDTSCHRHAPLRTRSVPPCSTARAAAPSG